MSQSLLGVLDAARQRRDVVHRAHSVCWMLPGRETSMRWHKAERGSKDGTGHTIVEVTDPSAEFFCSGNREPVPPGATGTESGLKVVTQVYTTGEGIKNKNRNPQALERRKQARRVARRTKRRARRQKSRKAVQSRVADTALPYQRAQEASDSVGNRSVLEKGQTQKENATQERKRKKGKHADAVTKNRVTIKQLENELRLWKKTVVDSKRMYEELNTLKTQVRTWCTTKIKLKETYHKLIGKSKMDRKPKGKKKKGRARDRLNIDNRDTLKLASWNIRGLQEKIKRQVLVQIMKDKKIDVMSLQETWVNTNSEEVVDGYHFIFHQE